MTTQQGSARILVVEDEPLVRMFAVDALEDSGFQVIQAGDAAEALTALSRSSQDLCAIIVDLGLPDLTGDVLATDVRALRADLPIVIASGRSERELKDRFAKDPRIAVLVKPYTSPMLIEALASLGVSPPA
jgi:CheY-like chemotaxis protein